MNAPRVVLESRLFALEVMLASGGDWAGPVSERVLEEWRREVKELRAKLGNRETP